MSASGARTTLSEFLKLPPSEAMQKVSGFLDKVGAERDAESAARAALEAMYYSRNDTGSLLRDAYEAIRANGEPLTVAQRAIVAVNLDTVDGFTQPTLDMLNAATASLHLTKPAWVDGRTIRAERIMPDRVEVVEEVKIGQPAPTADNVVIRDAIGRDKITTDQADDMSQDRVGRHKVHASPELVSQIMDAKLAGKLAEAQREAAEDAADNSGGGGVSIVTENLTVGGDIVPHDKVTVSGVRVDPKGRRRRKS